MLRNITSTYMINCFGRVGVWLWVKMGEDRELVEKATPSSTKYKNKWTVTIFGEWQISRSVMAPVLDPGGLFKGYDLHKGAQLSSGIEEMDTVTLIYWFSKFDGGGQEVGGEISTEDRL